MRTAFCIDACCSKLALIIGLNARQHSSAARCIPPPPPAHTPRIAQTAPAARIAAKDNHVNDYHNVVTAARCGNFCRVADYVLADPECVNTRCSKYCNGQTVVHHCFLKSLVEIELFRFLVELKADVNAKDNGYDPPHLPSPTPTPPTCALESSRALLFLFRTL